MPRVSDAQILKRKERDLARLDAAGTEAALQIGLMVKRAAGSAFRSAWSGEMVLRSLSDDIQDAIKRGMIASHVMGIYRAQKDVRDQTGLKLADKLDEVLRWLRTRTAMTPNDWDQLGEIYGEAAAREANLLIQTSGEAIDDAINVAVAQGAHTKGGIALVQEALGDTPAFRAEAIFRTQNAIGYSAGQWAQSQAPEIQDILWGYKYVTVGDNRVRPEHAAWDGVTLPKNDPWWDTHYPPNGWNCRCDVIEIFDEREVVRPPDSYTIPSGPSKGEVIRPAPAQGFAINFGKAVNFNVPGSAI